MWISKMLKPTDKSSKNLTAEITGASNDTIQTQGSNEYREVKILSPQGLAYNPDTGEKCVLLPINNTVMSLGNIMEDKSLDEGEIMLFSNDASITLKNDGRVLINGQVFINGEAY